MHRRPATKISLTCNHCVAKSISILCMLSDEEMAIIDGQKSSLVFYPGQLIFHEGAFPNGMYILHNGKVKVSKIGDEGKEKIVRFAKTGDLLGYRAMLSGDMYTASAYAIDEVTICYIPKETFYKVIQRRPELSFKLMKLLADDLKLAERNSTNIAQKNVRERMAETLLILKETYGFEEDNITLNVYLTREEIASVAGTSRETATRLLSEFNADGIIALEGKKIRLIDIPQLIQTARLVD